MLYALLQHESINFNPNVISGQQSSPAGALGIAQFMPATARELGVNPLDIYSAVPGAARYLSNLTKQFGGNTSLGLAAYNAGPGAIQRYGGIPPYPETQNYVNTITSRATQYPQYPQAQTQGANTRRLDFSSPQTAAPSASLSSASPSQRSYVVRPGDTLSQIAQQFLGSATRYPQLTGYRSKNPNLIFPGEVIKWA